VTEPGNESAGLVAPPAPDGGRTPWRAAGIGLTSLGAPIGIGAADHLLGLTAFAIELTAALTIIGTALFGSQVISERAFRILRWIANRPEPPAPALRP
jgi:hypothetical protein